MAEDRLQLWPDLPGAIVEELGKVIAEPPSVLDLAVHFRSFLFNKAFAVRDEGIIDDAGTVIGGEAGMHRGRRPVLVADLLMDEEGVVAALDQVSDVGAAERVEFETVRPPRSEGQSQLELGSANRGRPSSIHSAKQPTAHSNSGTVGMLHRFGGEHFIALPCWT